MIGDVLIRKYTMISQIGSGGFGDVFKVKNLSTMKEFAAKLDRNRRSSLQTEAKTLDLLQGTEGVPKLIEYGKTDQFSYIIMQLLGTSLHDLLKKLQKPFTHTQAASVGIKALHIIESVHSRGVIHRDIKPQQLLLSKTMKKLFLVDYGLSVKYQYTNTHIPFTEKSPKVGSSQFASLNVHKGYRQSRRDDLESLFYSLIYLVKGELPWSRGVQAASMSK